jgi:anti-anti-sigma factor
MRDRSYSAPGVTIRRSLFSARSSYFGGDIAVDALRLGSQRRGHAFVISVEGDLDIVTSPQFDDYLADARREHRHLILDLAGVEFMDTSSLAVIVSHWKKLVGQGGTLTLASARYRYTKTLWITGLAHRLPLYDSVDEAVQAVPAATPASE